MDEETIEFFSDQFALQRSVTDIMLQLLGDIAIAGSMRWWRRKKKFLYTSVVEAAEQLEGLTLIIEALTPDDEV